MAASQADHADAAPGTALVLAPADVGGFVKYDKMGEDSGAVGAEAGRALRDAYVATEKIHGANFCIIASRLGDEEEGGGAVDVQFAKRTAILGRAADAEDFYSCRSSGLLQLLRPRAVAVLERLQEREPVPAAVHIYGELFGGRYPHPEVPAEPRLEPVQVGVWYAPGLQFQAFDVAAETPGTRQFLDFHDARDLCEACGLPFAAALCSGTLAECLDFPVEFETTIPARLGLPQIPAASDGSLNLAEGLVIRPAAEPMRSAALACKSVKTSGRGLFKRKIEAFSEKKYQNNEWRKGKQGGAGPAGGGSAAEAEELVGYELCACATEQRLANVLSKTGRVDPRDKVACRQLLEDFKADVRDALEDHEQLLLGTSPALQGNLDRLCRDVITAVLLRKRPSH